MLDPAGEVYCRGSAECVSPGPPALLAMLATRLGSATALDELVAWGRAHRYPETYPPSESSLVAAWAYHEEEHAFFAYLRGADGQARRSLALVDRISPMPADAPLVRSGTMHELRPLLAAELARRSAAATRLVVLGDPRDADLADVPLEVLIGALGEVDARQQGQPGGVDLADDPIVRAIISRGEAAIDPLLEVLEHGDGSTRSVHFFRDFAPTRTILATYEAAYVAIANILDWSVFDVACTGCDLTNDGPEARASVAAAIRAVWESTRGQSRADRMFTVLADDGASHRAWAEAALALVSDARLDETVGSSLLLSLPSCRADQPARMLGEPLRSRTGPSVTELLVRRLDPNVGLGESACSVANALATWDAAAAAAPISGLARRCAAAVSVGDACPCVVGAVRFALAAGATDVIDEYAEALATTPAELTSEALELLVAHRDRPRVDAAVRGLLARGSRGRSELGLDSPPRRYGWSRTLLAVPEIRDAIDAHLRSELRVGTITSRANWVEIETDDGSSSGHREEAALEGRWPWRERDEWAAGLSDAFEGAPPFVAAATPHDRDAAITILRDWLASPDAASPPTRRVWSPCGATAHED
ncbi:MAG: hypothetical protein U0234_27840 [Sandaracinus sp.]